MACSYCKMEGHTRVNCIRRGVDEATWKRQQEEKKKDKKEENKIIRAMAIETINRLIGGK